MILPIGHEENRVCRQPWVTYGIMILCAILFLFTHLTGQRRLTQGLASLQQAVELYREHPYLTLDPRLIEVVRAQRTPSESAPQSRSQASDGEFSQLEQVELDGLTKAGFDALAELPQRRLGLVPAHVSLLGLLMHMFMHAGFFHLLGNILFLYLSAPFLEDVWGRPFFGAFYVAAGMFSGAFFAVRYSGLDVPLVGASGAIAAVIGAFLVRHWRRKIRFLYWFGFVIRGTFSAPAWAILPLYFLRELFSAWSVDLLAPGTGGAGVAYWAHVSGFGFGVVTAGAVQWFEVEKRYLAPALDATMTVLDNSGLDSALALRAEGHIEEAWALLVKEVRRSPGNADAVLLLWAWAGESDRAKEAAPWLVRLVRDETQRGEVSGAYGHWGEIRDLAPETAVPVVVEVKLAEALMNSGMNGEAREVAEWAIRRASADTPVGALLRLARLVGGDSGTKAARIALGRLDLSPELRFELEVFASKNRGGQAQNLDSAPARISAAPCGTQQRL